jgi:hypothetical protein
MLGLLGPDPNPSVTRYGSGSGSGSGSFYSQAKIVRKSLKKIPGSGSVPKNITDLQHYQKVTNL